MNTEVKERKDILKLCSMYLDKLYKNKEKTYFDDFKIKNVQNFDLSKYVILYYFKKIIESQLGEKKIDYSLDKLINSTAVINSEIDNYLIEKYRKNKLVENITNIPINSKSVGFIIPQNKKSIFSRFAKNSERVCLYEAENIVFQDRNYFEKYIELNINKSLEEFDLIGKLPLYILIENLESVLNSLKLYTIEELNKKSNKSNIESKFDKTKDLNLFMNEYIKAYFELELEKYILNQKIKLIEIEVEKSRLLNIEKLNDLIKLKEDILDIIEDLMCDLVFNDYRFKDIIDNIIQRNIYKIYDKIPYELNLNQAVDSIDQGLFVDLIYNTISEAYREIK